MQHDDLIWSLIKRHHCAFRLSSSQVQKFCQNVYNNTGLCNHNSCPLANSQYATIREVDGKLYLYMKVVERAAFPNRLWERVLLPNNYLSSMKIISRYLAFWQPQMVFKVKQRYTRMKQYMVRKKRIMKKEPEIHLDLMIKKHHKREKKLEHRALKAAKMEKVVENELKERLRNGVYSDIYNFDMKIFNRITEKTKADESELVSEDEDEFHEYEEEVLDEKEPEKELVESDFEDDPIESDNDIEDIAISPPVSKKTKAKPILKKSKANNKHQKVEFEYEVETEPRKKQTLNKLKVNF